MYSYSGHARLYNSVCVCVSLCLSLAAFPHYSTDSDVSWRNARECSLVVHSWADLQSVHGFRCYDNTAPNAKCQRVLSTRSMPRCTSKEVWETFNTTEKLLSSCCKSRLYKCTIGLSVVDYRLKTKLASVSLCRKSHRFKTANTYIKILSANSTHSS